MRIPWEQLEGGDQGLEMTFRGSGEWGVSTLKGYYERGQRLDPAESTREPYVTLFESESEAINYARQRARATKGTSYYVLDYEPGDPRIMYRVLRHHTGAKQRPGGGVLEPSREMVMVFENMRDANGKPLLLPDGRIRWKMVAGLSIEIQDPEAAREAAARSAGKLPDVQKAPLPPERTLSSEERLILRLEAEGYNAQEIAIRVAEFRAKRGKKGGMSGLGATRTPDDEEPTGNCYEDAATALLMDRRFARGWVLVHGHPTLQRPPFCQFGHAWLESDDGEKVYDASKKAVLPRFAYYDLGKIDYRDNRVYTRDETRQFLQFRKHWGPWEGPDADPPTEEEVEEWLEWNSTTGELPSRSLQPTPPRRP